MRIFLGLDHLLRIVMDFSSITEICAFGQTSNYNEAIAGSVIRDRMSSAAASFFEPSAQYVPSFTVDELIIPLSETKALITGTFAESVLDVSLDLKKNPLRTLEIVVPSGDMNRWDSFLKSRAYVLYLSITDGGTGVCLDKCRSWSMFTAAKVSTADFLSNLSAYLVSG